jgi:hypothetical protein
VLLSHILFFSQDPAAAQNYFVVIDHIATCKNFVVIISVTKKYFTAI